MIVKRKSLRPRAKKVVIYGVAGIGKSTLAAQFPDPLFIDTEDGLSTLDVNVLDTPKTFDALMAVVEEIAHTAGVCRTLVIDSIDWVEKLAMQDVISKGGKKSIEDWGYGKGYAMASEKIILLLEALDDVRRGGIHIVLVSHAVVKSHTNPGGDGSFDRWELELYKNSATKITEWCDLMLFLNREEKVIVNAKPTEKNLVRSDGERYMYTTSTPAYEAKSRFDLPPRMVLSYEPLRAIFDAPVGVSPKKDELLGQVRALMEKDGISEAELQTLAEERRPNETHSGGVALTLDQYSGAFLEHWIIKNWAQIVKTIRENPLG